MKRKSRLTTKQKNLIIKALAEGATQSEAARLAGTTQSAISQNESLLIGSNIIKKDVQKQITKEIVKDNKDIIQGLYRIQRDAIKGLTADKINSQSGSAIATTLAIAIDKVQLLTGGATENIHVTTAEKTELIDNIMRNESANNKRNLTISESQKRENGEKH